MLALGWLKYPGAQVILFDKDRSARAATLAVGGACYEPGSDRAPVAFQPLAHIDQAPERVWPAGFVATLLAAQGVAVDHGIQSAIDDTLRALAGAPPEQRTLTLLATHLGSRERRLREALRPYTLDGNFGQIFDADRDDVHEAPWTMIEMGHLMGLGEAVVIPALEYLFHRIERQFAGQPTLLIVDEAWLFLSHPVFARRLQAWLKTLRKKNVYVVFATQEVADATSKPELLSTILSACHTKIFLPDDEALTPAMTAAYQAVGLTTAEIDILARAQKKRDYYYRSVKGRRLFQLGLGPVALAFVGASSETDQRFLDEVVTTRPEREYACAMLERRGVTGAAAALRRAIEHAEADAPSDANRMPGPDGADDNRPTDPMLALALAAEADLHEMPRSTPDASIHDAPTVVVPLMNHEAETVEIPLDADSLDEDAVTLRIPLTERPAP
jgi:type IV secretion system protein VirB4